MSLFALSDLHLSLNSNKPMDIFGPAWTDHYLKIKENWNRKIKDDDYVLIAGDISWAMNLDEAKADIDFIHSLKGNKILIKGNHDYWWNSIKKLNSMYNDMFFIQNTFLKYEDYGICGTRGWINLNNTEEHDEKVYKREIMRLKMSLDCAKKEGLKKFIVMMHYPPATKVSESTEFVDILAEYNVEKLIYGHIHSDSKNICINGMYKGIDFICSSADIINFDPLTIFE